MASIWEINHSIKQMAIKRIVEDGNLIQQLIAKIDLQLSTDQDDYVEGTLNYLETAIEQLDADCSALSVTLNSE